LTTSCLKGRGPKAKKSKGAQYHVCTVKKRGRGQNVAYLAVFFTLREVAKKKKSQRGEETAGKRGVHQNFKVGGKFKPIRNSDKESRLWIRVKGKKKTQNGRSKIKPMLTKQKSNGVTGMKADRFRNSDITRPVPSNFQLPEGKRTKGKSEKRPKLAGSSKKKLENSRRCHSLFWEAYCSSFSEKIR